ncbi:glycosyltransferase family 39 protein [Jannaschia aquimarina]|uniref:Glycosyltransferase RgtA/B/C/D-like domain-containing protein n=2 Tax=Jannaschia aquimarina TaxID=935700 RepID=A0A0D1EJK8_9RHOB|nr:glycosyltransferase family 39 protein [Jannaschia aquimarina]KIT17171.1 hypothetical protein jaqu_09010 [Jannaschia aquimarina]SNT17748.1 Dolichyl-phosphate-mannose-protein mannosyltransferase [Jannaschia aquimarina]
MAGHIPVLLIGLHWLVIWMVWDGIGPRDAVRYVDAALSLLDGQVTDTHWGLRWPLVLPMAGSLAVFGQNEFAASLPVFAYSSLLVVISWQIARRWFGEAAGFAAGILFAGSGLFTMVGSGIYIFLPEIVFCVASLGLATQAGDRPVGRYALAGALVFLAWLCRETSGFMLPALVAGAFTMFGITRNALLAASAATAAFIGLVALEWLGYWLGRGDPLHRIWIDLGHGRGQSGTEILPDGMGSASSWLDPLFGALTHGIVLPIHLTAIAAAVLILMSRVRPRSGGGRALITAGVAAALSFAISVGLLNLETVFYFPIVPWLATMLAGWGLAVIARMSGKPSALAIGAPIIVSSFAIHDLTRDRSMIAARALADFAISAGEPVAADPYLAERARMFLRLDRDDVGRVVDYREVASLSGYLVFDSLAGRGAIRGVPDPTGWSEFRRLSFGEAPVTARLFRSAGSLARPVPQRLLRDPPGAVIWRVPEAASAD